MSSLQDNIKWFQDFNLNLGVNVLGGIFGVLDVFSDPVSLLRTFYDIIERGDELRQTYGSGTEKFESEMRKYFGKVANRLPPNAFEVLGVHYVPFYYEGCGRLKHNQEFIDWIEKTEFEVMPDIFSKYVLLYAISKIKINRKIAATVFETLDEMKSSSICEEPHSEVKSDALRRRNEHAGDFILCFFLLIFIAIVAWGILSR